MTPKPTAVSLECSYQTHMAKCQLVAWENPNATESFGPVSWPHLRGQRFSHQCSNPKYSKTRAPKLPVTNPTLKHPDNLGAMKCCRIIRTQVRYTTSKHA